MILYFLISCVCYTILGFILTASPAFMFCFSKDVDLKESGIDS